MTNLALSGLSRIFAALDREKPGGIAGVITRAGLKDEARKLIAKGREERGTWN
jgi:hypothetical protein